MYDDEPGRMGDAIQRLADGDPWPRMKDARGRPMTPCHQCPKVPREKRGKATTRADAIEPTEASWAILWHYRQCKAVGRHPEDALADRHAGLIAEMEASIVRARAESASNLLGLLFTGNRG
jgi:hypothetical protein